MRKVFKDLAIGEKFSDGVSIAQRAIDTDMYEVLVKTTKSTAKVIDQIGYGNKRAVNSQRKYAPNKTVFTEKVGNYVL